MWTEAGGPGAGGTLALSGICSPSHCAPPGSRGCSVTKSRRWPAEGSPGRSGTDCSRGLLGRDQGESVDLQEDSRGEPQAPRGRGDQCPGTLATEAGETATTLRAGGRVLSNSRRQARVGQCSGNGHCGPHQMAHSTTAVISSTC